MPWRYRSKGRVAVRLSVPSSERFTDNVPGYRARSEERSGRMHLDGVLGYCPRTSSDPPSGARMRADSGLSSGPSDTNGGGDGELAVDPEGRSGDVARPPDDAGEQAPRATSSAARVKNQTRRGGRHPATPRTLSAGAVSLAAAVPDVQAAVGMAAPSTGQIAATNPSGGHLRRREQATLRAGG